MTLATAVKYPFSTAVRAKGGRARARMRNDRMVRSSPSTTPPKKGAPKKRHTQATPEKIEALREEMGLNDSFFVQYFRWLSGCIKGDFGTSYSYHMSVSSLIMDKLPITITLTLFSFLIIFAVSIPLGVFLSLIHISEPTRPY